jgi:hypothetical protein
MPTCSSPSEGCARWTLRPLAKEMVRLEYMDTIRHVTMGAHLKHRAAALDKSRCLSRPSTRYMAETEDVLEVYR